MASAKRMVVQRSRVKPRGARPGVVDLVNAGELVRRKAAGTAWRAPFPERLHAFPV